ncbi:MAG: DNA-binding response regulator [Rhodothermaceae bacterium]|nr:MAG: DNA-binding response regulator [Rhodothermaceae bacterium]
MDAASIFLVDDHPIVREGLFRLIDREPDLGVCGEAEDAAGALDGLARTSPDVVVVDLSLKGSSGLDLIRDIKARWPGMKVLVLSMYDEAYYAERALRAGAMGYVMKQEPPRTVLDAIRQVRAGEVYVSRSVASRVLQGMAGAARPAPDALLERLSDRELQVFHMIGEGLSYPEVAARLSLSVKTVESHVERIKEKLAMNSGRELLLRAVEWVLRTQR